MCTPRTRPRVSKTKIVCIFFPNGFGWLWRWQVGRGGKNGIKTALEHTRNYILHGPTSEKLSSARTYTNTHMSRWEFRKPESSDNAKLYAWFSISHCARQKRMEYHVPFMFALPNVAHWGCQQTVPHINTHTHWQHTRHVICMSLYFRKVNTQKNGKKGRTNVKKNGKTHS